jgi:hypothetical protein
MTIVKRDHRNAEKELMQALAAIPVENRSREICPTPDLLRCFFAGSVTEESIQNQILSHLSVCLKCRHMMTELRVRRLRLRWAVRLVAAILFIAAILWTWPKRNAQVHSQEVAVVDFGPSDVTRGIEDHPIKVSHSTRRLRIVLPAVSPAGSYQVELLEPQAKDSPILITSAVTQGANQRQELNISVDLERVRFGPYLLAIRTGNSNWMYRTVLIEP